MKRIVLAFDGSEGSMGAVTALSHLELAGWTIDLLTVVDGVDEAWPSRSVAKARLQIERTLSQRGASVLPKLATGDPAAAVLDLARREDADLIVLGPRRNVALLERLLGTVSRAVIRQARCCVMIGRLTLAKESALLVAKDHEDVQAFARWWPRMPIPGHVALTLQVAAPVSGTVPVALPPEAVHSDPSSVARHQAVAKAAAMSCLGEALRRIVGGPATMAYFDPAASEDLVSATLAAECLAASEIIVLRNGRGPDLERLAAAASASLLLLA